MELNEEIKSVAALVTFRQLYDNGKKDIYEILSRFIGEIIITERKYLFELTWITENLKSQYGFRIPDYVVKTSINRLKYVTKENGSYKVDFNSINEDDLVEKYETAKKHNEKIIDELCDYVEQQRGEISAKDKEMLIMNFCQFLLEKSISNTYSDLISAFILKKSNTNDIDQIRLIKEGAILYAGLSYNGNVSERSVWKDDINIYVENEILFHLVGYNGEIFERIVKDMFSLIQEMNLKRKKPVIHIRYFKEVEKEIDDFFLKAQQIVKGEDIISIDNYAMNKIVEGCKSESDVIVKKSNFLRLISSYGISRAADYDYYKEDNYKYNLESLEALKKRNINEDKNRYIKHINYISILRKDLNQVDLKKSRHIVLTETGKILQISKDFCGEKLPYAINCYMLTNRLWFDLNKGFGARDLPASFDIFTKSKIVLSKLLTSTLAEKYDKVESEYKDDKIGKEELIHSIMTFREELKRPEDITEFNVEDVLLTINEEEVSKYKNEHEKLKNDLLIKNNEVKYLHHDLDNKNSEIKTKDEIILNQLNKNKNELKLLRNDKEKADLKILKGEQRFKNILFFAGILYIGIVVFMFFIHPKIYELLAAVIPFIFSLIMTVFFMLKAKKFDFLLILQQFIAFYRKIKTKKQYKKYNIDKIKSLEDEIQNLEMYIKK